MKIKVVGVEKLDYFSKKRQKQVRGISLNYVNLGFKAKELIGYKIGDQFISEDNPISLYPVQVGGVYTMYLDGYEVDYLAECNDEEIIE